MQFSNLAMNLKASEIRELLKLTTMPEIISFAGGLPAPELFPTEDLKKVDEAVLTKEGQAALQYGTTEGYTPLREQIAGRMKNPSWSTAPLKTSSSRPAPSRGCPSWLRFSSTPVTSFS